MKKITLILIFTITAALISCKLPSNIEVKTDNFKITIPTKTGDINLGVITNIIRNYVNSEGNIAIDDFYPEDLELYDMPDYPGMQAFLVAYEMQLTNSFDPDYYLDNIRDALKLLDKDAIDFSDQKTIKPDPIIIPDLIPDGFNDYIWLDLTDLFENMQNWINTTSVEINPVNYIPIPLGSNTIPLPPNQFPQIMAYTSGFSPTENFESVFIAEGELKIDFEITGCHNDIIITLDGVRLVEENTEIPIGNSTVGGIPISLNQGNNFKNFIIIDLYETQIFSNSPPQLKISSISYDNTIGPAVINASLNINAKLSGIKLSGATKLKNVQMVHELPDKYLDTMLLDEGDFPLEFLNAIVEDGSIKIEIELPYDIPHNGTTTYFEGVIMSYNICVKQDSLIDPEIPGETFYGLSGTAGKWDITQDPLSRDLKGKAINRKNLGAVKTECFVILKTDDANGGSSFNLFDDDWYNDISKNLNLSDSTKYPVVYQPWTDKVLPVKVISEFQIDELRIIRWKADVNELFELPDTAEIDFGDIKGVNVAQFIEEIMFEEISLCLDFTFPNDHPVNPGSPGLPAALQNRIALKIECADIGLNGATNTKKIGSGRNEFISVPQLFYPAVPPLTGTPKIITLNTQLIPIINGIESPGSKYIELGPIDFVNDKELQIYGKVDLESFNWEYAYINLGLVLESIGGDTLRGNFPTTRERWWDLSEANKYLSGFRLGNNAKAKIFLGGPHGLLDVLKPDISFLIGWVDPEESDDNMAAWTPYFELLFPEQQLTMLDTGKLPKLPGKNEHGDYVYRGRELPLPGQGFDLANEMLDVVSGFPKGMHVVYDLKMDERFKVTPTMFDNVEKEKDNAIEGLFVMLLPLEFIGEPGAKISFGNIFEENKDLFERNINVDGTPDNESSVFTKEINIKKLELKIDFDQQYFSGAHLHLDKNDKLFPGGINLNNGKNNSLTVKLGNNDLDIIKSNAIYPELKLSFPQGTTIQIPRNIMPIRITISVGGSYNINLDELGLNN